MKENIVFIENASYSVVKEALKNWIKLYENVLDSNLKIELINCDKGKIVLKLGDEIDNEIFHYLINYLTYPENIDYNLKVEGFTTIKGESLYPKSLLYESVLIYVPEDDKEHDIVIGVVKSNDSYKVDFGGNFKKIKSEKLYYEPVLDFKYLNSEKLTIEKKNTKTKKRKNALEKFNFRFKIIAPLFICTSLIFGYLTYNTADFVNVLKFSSFGLLFWIMLEFDSLRYQLVFFKFLLLSIIIASIGYYHIVEFNQFGNMTWLKSTKAGLSFLVIFKILRFFYIQKHHREPEFDKNAEKSADRNFSFILLIGTIFVSLLL